MSKKILTFIEGLLKDEQGNWSSKRFVGVLGALSLIVYMFIHPSEYSNSSVLIMSLGALGITGFEAIFKKTK
jgi:uncharacterized membrane protein